MNWRIWLFVGVALALVGLSLVLPTDTWVLALAAWIRGAGGVGAVTLLLVYVVGTVLLFPGSLLTLVAGFAYGPVVGTLVAWPSATLAAICAFLVARFVARTWIERRVAGDPRFLAIDRAVGESGFKIVLLLRLSPVFPFNFLNYALGLTRVSTRDYALASAAGMLPGAGLFAYFGSLATTTAALSDGAPRGGPAQLALYALGFAATLTVTVLLTRIARRELARSLDSGEDPI